jgi:hypothetical protein
MLAAARERGFDGQIITTRLSNEGARVITDERLP